MAGRKGQAKGKKTGALATIPVDSGGEEYQETGDTYSLRFLDKALRGEGASHYEAGPTSEVSKDKEKTLRSLSVVREKDRSVSKSR